MQRKFSGAVAIAAVLLTGLPCAAQNEARSGNFWLPVCESTDSSIQNMCLTYILGFMDAYRLSQAAGMKSLFCTPLEVSMGQIMRMTIKYIRDHPEKSHENFWSLIATAQLIAFPCPGTTIQKGPKLSK